MNQPVEIFTWAFWRVSIIIALMGGVVGAVLAYIELLTGS
jgi:hypothetical protein